MAEAFGRPAEVESLGCVTVSQTAAEKLVALTRRTAAEIASGSPRDNTLIRHLYDLHVTKSHYAMTNVASLAEGIMLEDAQVFGNQFPAYRANPMAETRVAISAFEADPSYAQNFDTFQRFMVYDEAMKFASCISTLKELADHFS